MLKAKKIAQDELNASLAEQASVLETDTLELRKLETAVANGATYEEAFASSIKNASTAAKEHAIQTKGASGSTDVFVSKQRSAQASLRATATASKTASVAMRALSMAMNMIVIGLITKGLELLGSAISNYIHRVEKANEKIEESRSSYEDAKSSIESMNDELKTTQDKIDDLKSKGTLSFTDKAELDNLKAQNDELERSISLEEKKKQNAASQTVNDIKQNKDTLSDDFEESIKNLSEYQEEYEHMKQVGIKGISDETVTPENYEVTMTAMDKNMDLYEKHVLENIEKFEKYKEDIINKYNTDDVSQFSQSDRDLYNSIVSQLQKAYKTIYSDSDYNKFVIEPIFNQDKLKGLQDQLLQYFVNGGSTDTSALEEKFGADIITALRNACEKAGIDFDKMIEDMYSNSQSKLDQIAPMIETPNGAEDAKQNQVSKKIRDYIQNDLSEEDRTILLNAEIPDDVKFKTKQDVDNFIDSLNKEADTSKETISFNDAWSGLEKGKDELVKLAEAGRLTANDLKGLEGGKTLMEKTGLSAEQLAEKINKLTDSATQLSSMSAQISKMSDMLADKKNGTVASASDLAGFDVEVRGLDSWKEFESVMGSTTSTMEECQAAANALATEWVNDSNFLSNLTDENKAYYETQLDQMGVANAQEVIIDALARKHEEEAIEEEYAAAASQYNAQCKDGLNAVSANLAEVTADEITRLQQEGIISADTAEKISVLAVKKAIANGTTLDTSGDIRNLANLAGAATQLGRLLESLAKIKQGFTNGMPSDVAAKQAESYQKQIEAYLTGGSNKNIGANINLNVNPKGSRKYKTPSTPRTPKKSKSESAKNTSQEFNLIEIMINNINRSIDKLDAKISNTWSSWSKRNKALISELKQVKKLENTQTKAANYYKKKASNVKLDSKTKKQLRDGAIDIRTVKDEKLANKMQKYQDYWESYKQYTDDAADSAQKYFDLLEQKFDDIQSKWDSRIGYQENRKNAVSDALNLAQSKGKLIGAAYYTKQKGINDKEISKYKQEETELKKAMKGVKKYSEQWYQYKADLSEVHSKYVQLQADNAELQRSINELKFDRFDELINKFGDIIDEADFLIDLLDSDNLFNSDNGSITNDGITAMGLTAQNYDVYLAEAEEYKKSIADLEQMYKNGEIGLTQYNSQMREYQQGMRDSIKSANDAKKAVISYVKQGLDAQNEALEKSVSKQKELLQQQKD